MSAPLSPGALERKRKAILAELLPDRWARQDSANADGPGQAAAAAPRSGQALSVAARSSDDDGPKVAQLSRELAEAHARIGELERREADHAARERELLRRAEAAEAELERLRSERDQLKSNLVRTVSVAKTYQHKAAQEKSLRKAAQVLTQQQLALLAAWAPVGGKKGGAAALPGRAEEASEDDATARDAGVQARAEEGDGARPTSTRNAETPGPTEPSQAAAPGGTPSPILAFRKLRFDPLAGPGGAFVLDESPTPAQAEAMASLALPAPPSPLPATGAGAGAMVAHLQGPGGALVPVLLTPVGGGSPSPPRAASMVGGGGVAAGPIGGRARASEATKGADDGPGGLGGVDLGSEVARAAERAAGALEGNRDFAQLVMTERCKYMQDRGLDAALADLVGEIEGDRYQQSPSRGPREGSRGGREGAGWSLAKPSTRASPGGLGRHRSVDKGPAMEHERSPPRRLGSAMSAASRGGQSPKTVERQPSHGAPSHSHLHSPPQSPPHSRSHPHAREASASPGQRAELRRAVGAPRSPSHAPRLTAGQHREVATSMDSLRAHALRPGTGPRFTRDDLDASHALPSPARPVHVVTGPRATHEPRHPIDTENSARAKPEAPFVPASVVDGPGAFRRADIEVGAAGDTDRSAGRDLWERILRGGWGDAEREKRGASGSEAGPSGAGGSARSPLGSGRGVPGTTGAGQGVGTRGSPRKGAFTVGHWVSEGMWSPSATGGDPGKRRAPR